MRDRPGPEWPLMTETVEGDPIHVQGRELVPLIRMTGRVRRSVVLSSGSVEAYGWSLLQLRPVALLDRSEDGWQRIAIVDPTRQWIRWLLMIALLIPCVAGILIYLARRFRARTS
jgi:hypothetical protein